MNEPPLATKAKVRHMDLLEALIIKIKFEFFFEKVHFWVSHILKSKTDIVLRFRNWVSGLTQDSHRNFDGRICNYIS